MPAGGVPLLRRLPDRVTHSPENCNDDEIAENGSDERRGDGNEAVTPVRAAPPPRRAADEERSKDDEDLLSVQRCHDRERSALFGHIVCPTPNSRDITDRQHNYRKMFVACHLFLGLILGLVFAGYSGDRRLIGFTALGAVLPDLLDKPVGHLLLAGTLDSGRTFGHGLLFLTLLTVAGIALYQRRGSFALLAIAAGTLSHQVLDVMWAMPVTWYFPLLGPYEPYEFTNYFGGAILAEISSLSEWIFLVAAAGITLAAWRGSGSGSSRLAAALIRVSVPLLGVLALVSVFVWAVGSPESILMAGAGPEDYLLLAAVAAVGVVGMIRYREFLYTG